jgi:hypothetical protein
MRLYVEDFARRCGWKKDSGEGAFEYVQRKSYAQGLEDATPPAAAKRKPLTDELIEYGKIASEMMARDQTRFDAACEVLRYLQEKRESYYYLHRMLTVIHGNEEAAHGIKEKNNG